MIEVCPSKGRGMKSVCTVSSISGGSHSHIKSDFPYDDPSSRVVPGLVSQKYCSNDLKNVGIRNEV